MVVVKKYLPETHSDLCKEWDYTKNEVGPEKVTYGSHKKIWWKCEVCSHSWNTFVYNRGCFNHGCPACSGRVATESNNLLKKFPYLEDEWDYTKNKYLPFELKPGSEKKVWWVCSKKECQHSWESLIFNRALKGKGCPACANQVVTGDNNLLSRHPDLCKEWDYEKNSIGPKEVVIGTSKKVWWVCKKCSYSWEVSVNKRTASKPTGCPACANRVVTEKNNLEANYPDLLLDWDYDRNSLLPSNIIGGSTKKVWWACHKCGFKWSSVLYNRVNGRGCPSCAGKIVTDKNRLSTLFSELCKEWDFDKNEIRPEEVSFGSGKKVWWVCEKCNHGWAARIADRTGKGRCGCPKCARGNISKISQRWLDSLNISTLKKEYKIKDLGFRVDGFDPPTNTVYEFLGDYWHGNPEIYSAKKINASSKKSFGKLYQETFDRLRLLEKAGYRVVYIWENDFKDLRKGEEV